MVPGNPKNRVTIFKFVDAHFFRFQKVGVLFAHFGKMIENYQVWMTPYPNKSNYILLPCNEGRI